MAFAFLNVIKKVGVGVARGIGNFIKKRKEKKALRIEKKQAAIDKRRLELEKLSNGGIDVTGGTVPFNANDIFRSSSDDGEYDGQGGKLSDKIKALAMGQEPKQESSMPVWLWPVVGLAGLLLLIFGLKPKRAK